MGYALSAWFVPTTTIALLPDLLMAAINVIPMYWISGIADDAGAFLLTCLGIALIIVTFQSIGFVLSILAGMRAGSVSMLFMTFCFLFTGVFVPLDKLAAPWLAYLNPLYYAECLVARIVFLDDTHYTQDDGSLKSSDDVLDDLSLVTPAGVCAAVLISIAVLARIAALLLLQRRMRRVLLVQQNATLAASATSAQHAAGDSAPTEKHAEAYGDILMVTPAQVDVRVV